MKTNSFQNHSNAETQNRQAKIKNTLKDSKIVMFGGERRTKSYKSKLDAARAWIFIYANM